MSINKPVIHIVTDYKGPRLSYVLDIIFNTHLGLEYEIHSESKNLPFDAIKIFYSDKNLEADGLRIYKHKLLTEELIHAQDISVIHDDQWPYFFQSFAFKGEYKFDLFSVVFYLLTRYEEYLRFTKDKYGRFSSFQSLAYRNQFLEIPIVDLWILDLKEKIEKRWKIDIPLPRTFKIEPTIDIDTPYAFQNRSLLMHSAAIARDGILLRFKRLHQRLLTLIGYRKDPFDTYGYVFEQFEKSRLRPKFFFLMQCYLPDDQNFSINKKAFKTLIKEISKAAQLGIHPSLRSQNSQEILEEEFTKLESYSSSKILSSRQHFLHLNFPDTYQTLLTLQIKHDHSMAYHDRSGFRASTSVPYPWYDLKNEEKTDLFIHPAQIMDATLKHHLGYNINQATSEIQKIKDRIKYVEGTFSFIWHNSSFSKLYGWQGWDHVFEECLK